MWLFLFCFSSFVIVVLFCFYKHWWFRKEKSGNDSYRLSARTETSQSFIVTSNIHFSVTCESNKLCASCEMGKLHNSVEILPFPLFIVPSLLLPRIGPFTGWQTSYAEVSFICILKNTTLFHSTNFHQRISEHSSLHYVTFSVFLWISHRISFDPFKKFHAS